MKTIIKQLLREGLLFEKLSEIDSDVDFIYDNYFKTDVDEIDRTGIITNTMFRRSEIDTSILKSADCIEAHKLNPCEIKINYGSNFYRPSTNTISVSVSSSALNFVRDEANGDIKLAADSLFDILQKNTIVREFNEERIKGSIHHELAHWIDDTFHNRHITNRLNKAMELKNRNINNLPVNASKMEVHAQMHNIKQLHNKYKNVWDELTFNDMLALSSLLSSINNQLSSDIRKKWHRDLKVRMNREGLLGKNMVN